MSRFDLVSGKKPAKSICDIRLGDQSSYESQQTSASRTMLIRGPNGYTLMVPLRNLRAQIMDTETEAEAIVQLTLPRKQAHALVADIAGAQNSNISYASDNQDGAPEPVRPRRSRPSRYEL